MKNLIILFALFLLSKCAYSQAAVTIDSAVKYQTIVGWGHGGSIFAGCGGFWSLPDTTFADSLSKDYLDYIIDDLGLTGSRTWEIGPRIDGTGMDNGDCDSIDWSKFQPNSFFPWQWKLCVYFKNRILAQGYQPSFYSTTTYPTLATLFKPWVMNDPGERAQQIWASALYLKNTYGIDINYAVIFNEPSVAASIIEDDIKALGPRLLSHGLNTKIQFAEGVAPQTTWNYIQQTQNDSDMWNYVGRISYHNYGTADPYRNYIRDFAETRGLTAAQTEMNNPTFDDLYNDLTLANCSYWEVGYSSGNILPTKSGQTQFTQSGTFFRLRQVMHYVRPGAVRIGASSADSTLHVLAFEDKGKIITIIENLSSTTKSVTINGLPPGFYGLSRSHSSATSFQEFGINNVGENGTLTINIDGNLSVATLYPYSGTNQPPTIMTWSSDKGYLVGNQSTLNLSVIANDAELDDLTYNWSVYSQPAGANAIISTPSNTNSSVSGLVPAGIYIFKIDVSDGQSVVSKKVYLYKYDSNPPAMIGQAGFRFAAPYGLVFTNPGDTTHANIELPTSSAILQVGVGDLAGSDFTGRGKWTLVSQPAGANAIVDSTIYIYISIRAQVTGMTVPGDYVFRVVVKDTPYPDLTTIVKCTVHSASQPPVISSITPLPSVLMLPESETKLTAITSDPEGDLLRHWWAIKSVPAGAKPVFDHQGLPVSNVSGMTVPGTYTFTLRCFDDLHMTTKDVNVIVYPAQNNTITMSPVPPQLCQGVNFTIQYQATGSYSAGNVFAAQLSDNNGTFLSPVLIGENSSSSSGTINAVIPQNTNPGSLYRIRVVSSNPSVTGSDNGSNISINPLPVLQIQGLPNAYKNSTGHYSVDYNPGAHYKWSVEGGSVTGSDNNYAVDVLWGETDAGVLKVAETTNEGCMDSVSMHIILIIDAVPDLTTTGISLKVTPNPVSGSAEIEIASDKAMKADIQIVNSYGIVVKNFNNVFLNDGTLKLGWDGIGDTGDNVPSGIYIIKLSGKYGVAVAKAVVER